MAREAGFINLDIGMPQLYHGLQRSGLLRQASMSVGRRRPVELLMLLFGFRQTRACHRSRAVGRLLLFFAVRDRTCWLAFRSRVYFDTSILGTSDTFSSAARHSDVSRVTYCLSGRRDTARVCAPIKLSQGLPQPFPFGFAAPLRLREPQQSTADCVNNRCTLDGIHHTSLLLLLLKIIIVVMRDCGTATIRRI